MIHQTGRNDKWATESEKDLEENIESLLTKPYACVKNERGCLWKNGLIDQK